MTTLSDSENTETLCRIALDCLMRGELKHAGALLWTLSDVSGNGDLFVRVVNERFASAKKDSEIHPEQKASPSDLIDWNKCLYLEDGTLVTPKATSYRPVEGYYFCAPEGGRVFWWNYDGLPCVGNPLGRLTNHSTHHE